MEDDHVAAAKRDEPPPLLTLDDLSDINPLDSKLMSAATLVKALDDVPPGETNWSGDGFPWWVFMAGRLHMFRPVVAQGIMRVNAINSGHQVWYMQVTTRVRVHNVCVSRGKVRVE